MLFTSYYGRAQNHPKAICISRWPPRWFTRPTYLPLAPSKELLLDYKQGKVDDRQYTIRFMRQLGLLDPHQVLSDIPDGSILVCYEQPKDFCHRHIVAEWLYQNTDTLIQEITSKDVETFMKHAIRQETI